MEPTEPKKEKPGRGPAARLKGQLLAYYQQHNPEKMKEVPLLAETWSGREALLWKTLRDKYEPVLDGDESSDLMLALQTVKAQSVQARDSKQSPTTSKQRAAMAAEETAAAAKQMLGRTAQMLRRGAQRQKEKLVSKPKPAADRPEPKPKKPMDPVLKVRRLASVAVD
jgi:hypothetical protein